MFCKIKKLTFKNETFFIVSVLFLLMTLGQKKINAVESFPFDTVSQLNDYSVLMTAIESDDEVIWLGTLNGLIMIQSGKTELFNVLSKHTLTNHVSNIAVNDRGEMWAGFVGGGVFYFNRQTNEHYLLQDKYPIEDLDCYDVAWDDRVNKLLLACDAKFYILDLNTGNFQSHIVADTDGKEVDGFYSLGIDVGENWFLGTFGNGLYEVNKTTLHPTKVNVGVDYIHHLNVYNPGKVMISSDEGVFLYFEKGKKVERLNLSHADIAWDQSVLSTSRISENQFVFVFSAHGLFEFDLSSQSLREIQLFSPYLQKKHIGYVDTVNPLQNGLLMGVGADDKGFYVVPLKHNFTDYYDNSLLVNSEISLLVGNSEGLFFADNQNLVKFNGSASEIFVPDIGYTYFMYPFDNGYLLSTYQNGFVQLDKEGNILEKNMYFDGLPSGSSARYSEILQISENEVLIGTDISEERGLFIGNFIDGFKQIHESVVVTDMTRISLNKILVTSAFEGLLVYDLKSGIFQRYLPDVQDLFIDCIEKLDEHRFLICVRRNKPIVFDLRSGSFSDFSSKHDMLRNIRDAQMDKNGFLWLTSSYGLYVYDSSDDKVTRITKSEGVKSNDFTLNGILPYNDSLIIPGNKGIVEIDVDKAKAFLDFKKGQKTESFVTRAEYILDEQTESQQATVGMMEEGISLPHSNIVLKLKFSHNNFLELEDLAFDVRMLGLNSDWTTLEAGEYTSTYTTLPPGDYEFQVRVNDPRSLAPQPVESISVSVLPPWWQTTWAYLSYLVLLIIALHVFSWYRNKRLLAHNKLLTKEVAERTRTIDELLKQKQTFFANVSHEFRTPLSLIMGPLEALANAIKMPEHQKHLDIMRRNTNRLMKLVDQILDLAKFETSQSLPKQVYELQSAMEIMVASFAPLLDNKQQRLRLENFSQTKVRLVEDSFEIIMTNLISNAIKYCPAGTEIVISMRLSGEKVEICVVDNGPGISEENLKLLFERFTRFEAAENIQGSGIGLALVKQLVNNNGGSIEVGSTLGHGTTFCVRFPLNVKADAKVTKTPIIQVLDSEFIDETSSQSDSPFPKEKATEPQKNSDNNATAKPRLLIVEDNADLRSYLSDSLKDCYELDVAVNGEQGWQKAKDAIPDLILSDVLMPIMDGYQLANRIRSDEVTSHIPIILITAKGDDLSRMKGWEEQVDDYISKPFKMSELKIRIKRLLSIRDILRKKHTSAVANNLAKKNQEVISFQTKKDADFFVAFEKVISEHFADEHFTRTEAAQYLNMVPRQLNRKLSALMDYNFTEYLRKYRLQKSTGLLLAGKQVTEVAYDVGFNSPSYFSSCFKAEFDETPSEYVDKRESDQSSS